MMKGIGTLLKNHGFTIIASLGVTCTFFHFLDAGYIKSFIELNSSEHFSILSIASLFGGFIFTGLGIILSSLSSERLARLNRYGYMDRYYHEIYLALFCNIITIISAIILISSTKQLYCIAIFEQLMLYLSIMLFIKCMLSLRKVVEKMRKE